MTRSDLIERLTLRLPHLYQADVEKIVNIFFNEISAALARGERVELRGFGAFQVKERRTRVSRNPRTGEKIYVSNKTVPSFRAGKRLKEIVNNKE